MENWDWGNGLGRGTLVAIIPSASGLIVAADSRITFHFNGTNLYCDNIFKITEPAKPDRTLVTITGSNTNWHFTNVPPSKVCEFIAENPAQFDANSIVKSAIENNPALATVQVGNLPELVVKDVNSFLDIRPGAYDARKGKQMFRVAISTYEPSEMASTIVSFSLDLSLTGEVTSSTIETQRFEQNSQATVQLFGESGFLVNQVLNGPGKQFLDARYGRFQQIKGAIRDVPAEIAADFASNLIEAAARTTLIVPVEAGIGGPVDIALIGSEPRPKRIRWK